MRGPGVVRFRGALLPGILETIFVGGGCERGSHILTSEPSSVWGGGRSVALGGVSGTTQREHDLRSSGCGYR